MARHLSPTSRAVQYNGVHGNCSVGVLEANLDAAAPGDVVVLGEFDSKPTVTDFRLNHEALGDGVQLDIGLEYPSDIPDETDVLLSNEAVASDGTVRMNKLPVTSRAKVCRIVAKVKGGAASGDFTLTVFYQNAG